jgi:hypothetical protein
MLLRVAIYAAILFAALFLFAQYIRTTGMFFPDKYPVGDWNAHGTEREFVGAASASTFSFASLGPPVALAVAASRREGRRRRRRAWITFEAFIGRVDVRGRGAAAALMGLHVTAIAFVR